MNPEDGMTTVEGRIINLLRKTSSYLIKTGGSGMKKAELVQEVTNQTGLTKKTSRGAVDAMTSVIADAFTRGEKVTSKPS